MAEPMSFTAEQVRGKRTLSLNELRFLQRATRSGMSKDEAWDLVKSGEFEQHELNAPSSAIAE